MGRSSSSPPSSDVAIIDMLQQRLTKVRGLEVQIDILTTENSELKKANSTLTEENSELGKENSKLREQNTELEHDLSQANENLLAYTTHLNFYAHGFEEIQKNIQKTQECINPTKPKPPRTCNPLTIIGNVYHSFHLSSTNIPSKEPPESPLMKKAL